MRPACPCGEGRFERVFAYDAPPPGEVPFPAAAGRYRRAFLRCAACGHFVAEHDLDLSRLYEGDYVTATYGGEEGIARAFARIRALPPERSDNAGRVARIVAFARRHISPENPAAPTVLDVGSGLCVFLAAMREAGWSGTALDPDPRAVRHAERLGLRAVRADFFEADGLGHFDLVTFNKVIEHVVDPVSMVARALRHVRPDGFVYVEVPDGEAAAKEGPNREEFFVDHWHAFSPASLRHLAKRAGFRLAEEGRLVEPSGKRTLFAFLAPAA